MIPNDYDMVAEELVELGLATTLEGSHELRSVSLGERGGVRPSSPFESEEIYRVSTGMSDRILVDFCQGRRT